MARKLVFDRGLFATVLMLTGLGLVMVYSASAALARDSGMSFNPLFVKQSIAGLLGLAAMLTLMHVDYRILRRPAVIYTALGGALLLLVAVLFTPEINNARRWFFIAGVSVQPSELAKLVLIPFLAYQIDRKSDRINSFSFLIPCAGATGLMVALVVLGRDLGTMILLSIPPLVMVFLAGLRARYLLAGGAVMVPLVALAVITEPYRWKRLTAFLAPENDPLGTGFQPLQSLIAVGSGGLFGLGPGNSMQKLFFLPSPHADFIFSIVAEELGFLGAVFLVALFAAFLWRGVLAGMGAPDLFGRYLAWGLTCMVVAQALIHMSVALSLMPTTGVPLPLISHGGSSLLTTLAACGLILNVSQHR
ncbi:MAG: putative lipid II flippase FtsW [bacterium]|nr:putative lipid II flippase FtsW [bacterium]